MAYTRTDWSQHHTDGRRFRSLGDKEKALLAEHAPPPAGGRALDLGCGTGELAASLVELGYAVDAVDFAEGALTRAAEEHMDIDRVRWLCLDVERDDLAELDGEPYDLITLRQVYAFLHDRARILRTLASRLREDGVLVVITPVADTTPEERRHVALDEEELAVLAEGWQQAERYDADGLAFVVLRGPGRPSTTPEKNRPAPQAVFGACTVLTDDAGRMLLGRSTRGMWQLPGGHVESSESAIEAAVRELTEKTGLHAELEYAHLVTILHDDREDVRRLTAVVRISAWSGTLALPEPHHFHRWEWHEIHSLAVLGPLFAPSAQALEAIWPGVLPMAPPTHSYPHTATPPPVPGEPTEAVRLRQQMAERVVDGGWAPSPPVQEALRTVPRHRFLPECPLRAAYADDAAPATRRNETGETVSSVSAPWLQADMIEKLRLESGATVLEVGSGGYNAELIAHVTGPTGQVVTVDVDQYVVHRTRRFTAEAGSGRVIAVHGDGSLGAAGHVPKGGFDGIVVTHNCWDIAAAWREQLAEGRFLVVPLSVHGYTRSIALQRQGEVLHGRDWTYCGFVRDCGQAARTPVRVPLADGAALLQYEDGPPLAAAGLNDAVRGPRHEVLTGVTLPGNYSFETLQLYLATTLPGFCRLAPAPADSGTGDPFHAPFCSETAAVAGEDSLAYLTTIRTLDRPTPEESRWEFVVHAFGPAGPVLAEQMAAGVRNWDRLVRESGYPPLTVHPAVTPDSELPAGRVLDKTASRLVFHWPLNSAPEAKALTHTAGT